MGYFVDWWPEPVTYCIGLAHSADWWPEPLPQHIGGGHSTLVKAKNFKVVCIVV